ncbi:MAG: 1-deoxy-D-xylulose-5-phosphate synthase [Desulfatiglandales bacterium]
MKTEKRRILDLINGPEDLKSLRIEDLEELASEIREVIIDVVSENGGHLAPSLGVVELTLALHYVFDSPVDSVIFDVGHQSYAHKIITGRREKFRTLRKFRGIAGFPKRSESIHDPFDTGHSSTSISAGLGMSTARSLKGQKGKVVVVIGDGSMTAGLAFEALNMAGHTERDLLVILNDNEMSISPNVGAFSSFLSRKMRGRRFQYLKRELENFFRSIPGVGENILSFIKKSEDSIITLFTPGMLFEAFRFKYIGPINGHNIELLVKTFNEIRDLSGPVLVHVLTKKGKGYPFAEADPSKFHGVGPFEKETGRLKDKGQYPTYTQIFGNTLVELAEEDKRIFAITAAMKEGTGLKLFSERFRDRFVDVGIAEQHAVTFAAGLALEGFRPVVAIYSTFLQRAYDQIIHDVCLPNLHVVFAVDRAGLVGEDGPTHHGQFDLSYLRCLPNMTLMAPKDESELRNMLYTALNLEGPAAIRYPRGRGTGAQLQKEFTLIPIGRAEILRDGKDLVIVGIGSTTYPCMKAGLLLKERGVDPFIINARFVKPLDQEMVRLISEVGRCLVVEENSALGGLGSAILEEISKLGLRFPKISIHGLPDRFVEHGSISELRELVGLTPQFICQKALELFET